MNVEQFSRVGLTNPQTQRMEGNVMEIQVREGCWACRGTGVPQNFDTGFTATEDGKCGRCEGRGYDYSWRELDLKLFAS